MAAFEGGPMTPIRVRKTTVKTGTGKTSKSTVGVNARGLAPHRSKPFQPNIGTDLGQVTDVKGLTQKLAQRSREARARYEARTAYEMDLDAEEPATQVAEGMSWRAERLLSWVCAPDELEEVLGDFEQHFIVLCGRRGHGLAAARQWYWAQVTKHGLAAIVRIVRKGSVGRIKGRRVRK